MSITELVRRSVPPSRFTDWAARQSVGCEEASCDPALRAAGHRRARFLGCRRAEGRLFHAAYGEDEVHVFEVWDSPDNFDAHSDRLFAVFHGAAVDAGNELAGYLGTGAGRIQFPDDVRWTIRQVGTTLIFYTWAPSTSPDPGSPKIADALATLGTGFTPPR